MTAEQEECRRRSVRPRGILVRPTGGIAPKVPRACPPNLRRSAKRARPELVVADAERHRGRLT